MTKILVTGSDGYIGSVLTNDLIRKGYDVTGLDTLFFSGCELGNLDANYNLVKGDTRKKDNLGLEQFDAIIYLAALSNDPMGNISPNLTQEINHVSTVSFASKAKEKGVKRFIFSSSCSIYGIGKEEIVSEDSPVNPLTAYAKSKIMCENDLLKLTDGNFCVGILRNSTVYGYAPKFRDDLVVNNLVTNGFANKKIKVLSDGTPWRPLIDIRDLSSIFIEFLFVEQKLINGQVFNIGFKENNFQVKDLLNEIQKQMSDCAVVYTGEHGADTRSYKVNFDRFQKVFPHVKQQWSLSKSIADLIERLKKYNFSDVDIQKGTYSRIAVLKKLIAEKKIDENLYWLK